MRIVLLLIHGLFVFTSVLAGTVANDPEQILSKILSENECGFALKRHTELKEHRVYWKTDPSKTNQWGMPLVSFKQSRQDLQPNRELDVLLPRNVAEAIQGELAFLPFWRFFMLFDGVDPTWDVEKSNDGMAIIVRIASPFIDRFEFRIARKGIQVPKQFGEWPLVNAMKVRIVLHNDDLFEKKQSEYIMQSIEHAREMRGVGKFDNDFQFDTSIRRTSDGLSVMFFDLYSELDNLEVFGRSFELTGPLYNLFDHEIGGLDADSGDDSP